MGRFPPSSFPHPLSLQHANSSLRHFTSDAVAECPKQLHTLQCFLQKPENAANQIARPQGLTPDAQLRSFRLQDGDSRALRCSRGRVTTLPHAQGWRPFPIMGHKFTAILKLVFLLSAISLTRAFAAVHPVPLEKNVDAAKCLECHLIMPRLNSELMSFGFCFSDCCSSVIAPSTSPL